MKMPTDTEALSAEWLSDALRAAGVLEDGRVRSFHIQELDGAKGALSQLAKLNLEYEGDSADAPHQVVAKFALADPENRALLHSSGFYEREVRFYQTFAHQVDLRTPRCFYAEIDSNTGEFALLLEDLAPAENGSRAVGCSPVQAELAIREMARFHAAWWESPQLTQTKWLRPLNIAARQQWSDKYQHDWEAFVEKTGSNMPSEILEVGQQLGPRLINVFERFYDESPQTLIHSDFQLDNFFFAAPEGGTPFAVIDWQLISPGCGTFDIGSFLGGNLSIADRRTHEMTLLKTYHSILVENGIEGYSYDRCLNDYRFAMFDGLFRMVVALGGNFLQGEQERSHRDAIWPRYQAAILDLNVAELLPD
jgi:hypothetical protein